jgi:phospholipid-binding lipoprotein MlaA
MTADPRRARSSRPRLAGALAALLLPLAVAASPARAEDAHRDPWISINRPIFRFNDALDRYALEPVAKGYDRVVPGIVKGWIWNFTANLWFPVNFVNCVLQAKPHEATQTLARFMLNSTAGLGGFGDPASKLGVPAPEEDFGQTLGTWGLGTGPYLVLPLFGPSDVRDTAGRIADSATRVWPYYVPWWASSGEGALEVVSTRAKYLANVKALRDSSVDYYASVRDAYLQRRQALVEDRVGNADYRSTDSENELYYPEDTDTK